MINKPKIIIVERPDDEYIIAVTDGSGDYRDAIVMTVVSNKQESRSMEKVLFFAAQRILHLEKGGYSPPPIHGGKPECGGQTTSALTTMLLRPFE